MNDWSGNWIWGLPLILLTVLVHVLGLLLIREWIVLRVGAATDARHSRGLFIVAIGTTVALIITLHTLEAVTWAFAYLRLRALPDLHQAMLYSLSAMTTYDHETFQLAPHWQMMGALEALDGLILFGLTTAFLFSVIQAVSAAAHRDSDR